MVGEKEASFDEISGKTARLVLSENVGSLLDRRLSYNFEHPFVETYPRHFANDLVCGQFQFVIRQFLSLL